MTQPLDRLDEDEDRESGERPRVDEARENPRALVAVRFFRRRRPPLQPDGEKRDEQREAVGQVVERVAGEREGVAEDADGQFGDDEYDCGNRCDDKLARDLSAFVVFVIVTYRVDFSTFFDFCATASAIAFRVDCKRAARSGSAVPMICAARMPAFLAPPIATDATGIPGGICTIA